MSISRAKQLLESLIVYEAPLPDKSYTDTPGSGDLDIERQIDSKPAWENIAVGNNRRAKKIIITDWSSRPEIFSPANALQLEKEREVFWKLMLEQGVECYVWTGKLVRVKDIESLKKELANVQLVSADELRPALAQHGITKDESQIVSIEFKDFLRELIPLINEAGFKPTPILLNNYNYFDKAELLKLFNSLNQKVCVEINFENNRNETIANLLMLLKECKKIKRVSLQVKGLSIENFKLIIRHIPPDVELSLSGAIADPDIGLDVLLSYNNNLMNFEIKDDIAIHIPPQKKNLAIKKLGLNTAISDEILEKLLTKFPNVTELTLHQARNNTNSTKLFGLTLLPQLQSLTLRNVTFKTGIKIPCPPLSLNRLTLEDCSVSTRVINNLLSNANNLETLDINNITFMDAHTLGKDRPLVSRQMEKLRRLSYVRTMPMEEEQIVGVGVLLRNSPNLETINIESSEASLNFRYDGKWENVTYLSLKTLDKIGDILNFCQNCPNLQKLNLTLESDPQLKDLENKKLNALTELTINLAHSTSTKALALLLCTPNITHLKIDTITLGTEVLDLPKEKLPVLNKLTYLDLSLCDSQVAKRIVELSPIMFPNLREIKLNDNYLMNNSLESACIAAKTIKFEGVVENMGPHHVRAIQSADTRVSIKALTSYYDAKTTTDIIRRTEGLESLYLREGGAHILEDLNYEIPSLKHLVLRETITPRQLHIIFKMWPSLKLEIKNYTKDKPQENLIPLLINPKIEDDDIRRLHLSKLYFTDNSSNIPLTAVALTKVLKNSPFVEQIKIGRLHGSLPPAQFTCSFVEDLEVYYPDISFEQLLTLVDYFPNLKKIHFKAKIAVTMEQLMLLFSKCKGLNNFNHYGIDDLTLDEVASLCPNIVFNQIPKEEKEYMNQGERIIGAHPGISNQQNKIPIFSDKPPSLDAQTKGGEAAARQFFVYKAFDYPAPNHYRLKVYEDIEIGSDVSLVSKAPLIKSISVPIAKTETIRQEYDHNYHKNSDHYFGEYTANTSDWFSLPSLSAKEEILQLSANVPVEIGYCEEKALYYVRAKEPNAGPVTVNFILKSSPPLRFESVEIPKIHFQVLEFEGGTIVKDAAYRTIKNQFAALTKQQKLSALYEFCRSFEEKDTNLALIDGVQILNTLLESKAGVCRHRSLVFMALCKAFKDELENDGIRVSGIFNDCHAYMEASYDNQTLRMDLGGGIGNVHIKEMDQMVAQPKEPPVSIEPAAASSSSSSQAPVSQLSLAAASVYVGPTIAPEKRPNPFHTWDTIKSQATDMRTYCDEIMQAAISLPAEKRNVLIALDEDQIDLFHEQMTAYLQQKGNQSLYLNSLNDASEKQAKVTQGELEKTPSNMVEYLKKAKQGDAFISNWSDYSAIHVGFNTLVDNEERKFKTHSIHPEHTMITVMSKEKIKEMGEDFFSRFRVISDAPVFPKPSPLNETLKVKSFAQDAYTPATFYDSDWKNLLIGKINVNEANFIAEEGLLIKALKEGKKGILLQNAPWHKAEFRQLINELRIKRKITYNGTTFTIPADFEFVAETVPYKLNSNLLRVASPVKEAESFLLNSQTFKLFIRGMRCTQQRIIHQPGWLEKARNKEINVLVSETLSPNAWAHLISVAEKYNVTINLQVARNVKLPNEMTLPQVARIPLVAKSNHSIIVTTDLELAEANLFAMNPKATIVPITSETRFNDIIERPVKIPNSTQPIAYDSVLSNIWQKLLNGGTIILKGELSETLARQLESLFFDPPYLWINGAKQTPRGKLIILTDNKNPLSYVPERQLVYEQKHIWETLDAQNTDNPLYPKFKRSYQRFKQIHTDSDFTYGQLRAMLDKLHKKSHTNPFKSYFRLDPNDPALLSASAAWSKLKKEKKGAMIARHEKILSELDASPYLFVAGPSGVGKSTYVLSRLRNANRNVHVGVDNIKNWLRGKGDKDEVLFIDEANLERAGTWDFLEGLFNKTPGVVYEGQFYPLTKHHKVVFAGNYSNFVGRTQHRFFIRHGQVINFKEMPEDVLASEVIVPGLKATFPWLQQQGIDQITRKLLDAYKKINQFGYDHPFTPRNLKIICLRAFDYMQRYKLDHLSAFDLAIVDEASGLIPNSKSNVFAEWIPLKEQVKKYNNEIPSQIGKFYVTESRRDQIRLLQTQFQLRDYAISNPALASFDIPSLLIEGAPGIGKSLMVIEYLKANGYTQGSLTENANINTTKNYYYLTPTDPDKMKATLIKAFHEGAIVVIDEINSIVLERLMNQLLSGYDPDGNRAKQKGFMIIGTQNPITFTGRQKLSSAFENRFRKMEFKDYPASELVEIATVLCRNMQVSQPNQKAQAIVRDYLDAKQFAELNNKRPAPTPRDLFAFLSQKDKVAAYDILMGSTDNMFIDTHIKVAPESVEKTKVENTSRVPVNDNPIFAHQSTLLFYEDIQQELERISQSTYGSDENKKKKIELFNDLIKFTVHPENKDTFPSDIINKWLSIDGLRKTEILKHTRREFVLFSILGTDSQKLVDKYKYASDQERAERRQFERGIASK